MVSWDCAGAGARSQERISHLALGTGNGRARRAGAGADNLGYTKMREEDLGNAAVTAGLGFWSPAGSYFVSKGDEGAGYSLGILITPMPFRSTRNVPSW